VLGSNRVYFLRALSVALALAMLCVALSAVTVFAQNPTPAPSGVLIDPLDPRAGSGANRVGAPLLALVAVIGIGAGAAIVTALYIKVVRTR
jgi:hypothetical protein